MLIINAKIITMEEENFENGFIEIENEKIKSVGNMSELKEISGEAFDLKGAAVYPGFIDAHCHIGVCTDGIAFEGEDLNEENEPVTPQLRAVDAINGFDRCYREALAAGVTSVVTGPGSANPISGQILAMKTAGHRVEEMLIKEPVGIKFALGENPKNVYGTKNQTPVTRMAISALIREQLQKAKRYIEDVERALADEELDPPEYDIKCEALLPLLKREIKAYFHAHRADDIFTAIRIANEFNLDYVLVHATEGHKIADELFLENAKVVTGPIISDRSKPELAELTVENTAKLVEAGLEPAICTDHPETPIQYLSLSAAVAMKGGLSKDDALKSLTINPAKIIGLDDKIGSIKAGKDADLVVFDGNPFDVLSSPEYVFVNGKLCFGEKNQ